MTADSLRFGDDLAAFADSVIGSGLSPQVRRCAGAQVRSLIEQAATLYESPAQALALLEQARAAAPSPRRR
jgi:hypothetical protein